MPRRIAGLIVSLALLSGCSSFKQDVGDYVKDAVVKSVEDSLDKKLSARGLSVGEIKAAVDTNHDGKITAPEVYQTFKDTAKDAAVLEAKKLVDAEIAQLKANSASKDDLDHQGKSHWNNLLLSLLGLLSTYLAKQIMEAKKDTARDHRIAMLEKALGSDLDGDGKIGDDPAKASPKV